MIRRIQKYIETNHLLTSGKFVITGFSGGRDSVALLHILNKSGYNCIAAHCNFHLRGDESNQDESFCRQFAGDYNIIYEKVDFNTTEYAAEQHISIEMAARELRYNWFETIRKKYDAQAIAIAHHSDDSSETMLLNLIRGTGIHGLCGIRPKNEFIVRPMLCVSRDEINKYIEEQNLPYVTDSSNLSDVYTRNFIRLNLLPLMEKINPSVRKTLERTAEHLSDAECIYNHTIELKKKELLQKNFNDGDKISIIELVKQPAPKTILYELIKPYGFTREITEDIFLSLNGESGKKFKAPDCDYSLLKDREFLFLYKQEKDDRLYEINENNLNSEQILTSFIYPDFDKYTDENGKRLPLETIEEDLRNEVNLINKNLPSFKHINNVIIRTEEFEKTTSKKIIRYKIK